MDDDDQPLDDEQRRRQVLEGARHLGGTIAGLGWLAAFIGLLITLYVRADFARGAAQASAGWADLVPPLLLCIVGVGVAALGHLLRALPAMCGIPESVSAPGPRNLNDFIRHMRARQD